MKINSIILNVLFIIILICLIYFFIYLNNSNFENFNDIWGTATNNDKKSTNNTNNTNSQSEEEIQDIGEDIDSQNTSVSTPIDLIADIELNNGYKSNTPLKNAYFGYILELSTRKDEKKLTYLDGYYWINIKDKGTQFIYCIMDKKYRGGGWMLAMRSVYNSRNFSYDSKYFTQDICLNDKHDYIEKHIIKGLKNKSKNEELNAEDLSISSIGSRIYDKDLDPAIYDAKFETFNSTPANEWMAIFYVKDNKGDIIKGGDYKNNNRGWVWYEDDVRNSKKKIVSPLELFRHLDGYSENGEINNNKKQRRINKEDEKAKRERGVTLYKAQNMYGKFSNATKREKNILYPNTKLFSSRLISEDNESFYGLNYNTARNYTPNRVRWGFYFNDNRDNIPRGCFGGIGTVYDERSAGNFEYNGGTILDKPDNINSSYVSYAVEWYVREKNIFCK